MSQLNPHLSRLNLRLSQLNPAGLKGEAYRTLRVFRKVLLEYVLENGYDRQNGSEEKKLCAAYYTDGEQEVIDLRTFDILIRNEVTQSFTLNYFTPKMYPKTVTT